MRSLLLLLCLIFPPQTQPQSVLKPKHELVRIVQCVKVPSGQPNHTGLECGKDEHGEPNVLDIPETIYQFRYGKVFNMYVYTDGESFPEDKQPEGSTVIATPPCVKAKPGYPRPPLNGAPCNPELSAEGQQ